MKSQRPESHEGTARTREHMNELLRANHELRDELSRTRSASAILFERLQETLLTLQSDRKGRLAALNLMEDAVIAREAVQDENRERRRVENRLREADRRKDEFLATLAHELRNPLAPIRNS